MLEQINSFSVKGLALRVVSMTLWPLLLVGLPVLLIGFIYWDTEGRLNRRLGHAPKYWNERHSNALVRSYCTGLHIVWRGLRWVLGMVVGTFVLAVTPAIWLLTGKRYIRKLYVKVGILETR